MLVTLHQEGSDLVRKSAPMEIKIYYPKTEEGRRELASRVASVHADYVQDRIQKLNCPISQKLKLLECVIADRKKISEKKNPKRAVEQVR